MYPLGIDDTLKTTPLCGISSFASSPYPRRLTIVTNLNWTLHHSSIVEQGLGVRCLVSKLSRPSPRCSSLSDVDLREHVGRSFLARILSDRWPPFRSNRPCIVRVLHVFIVFFARCVFASATFSLSPRFPIDWTTRSVKIGPPKRLTPPSCSHIFLCVYLSYESNSF